MIWWLNGAYGSGKSTVAEALRGLLPEAHIFDAEALGNAVRDNFPEACRTGVLFEEYPLWREFVVRLLREIGARYDGDLLVPMTLLLDVSYDEIIQKLAEADCPIRHVILDADEQTLRARILARGETEDCWCMRQIPRCIEALAKESRAIHIDTRGKTPEQIAKEILARGREQGRQEASLLPRAAAE